MSVQVEVEDQSNSATRRREDWFGTSDDCVYDEEQDEYCDKVVGLERGERELIYRNH